MKNETAAPFLGAATGLPGNSHDDDALMAFCDERFAGLMSDALVHSPSVGMNECDDHAKDRARMRFLQSLHSGGVSMTQVTPIRDKKKAEIAPGLGPRVFIGFDAEWEFLQKGKNRILSIQFYLVGPNGDVWFKVIHLVRLDDEDDMERPRLCQAVYDLLEEAEDNGVIDEWPSEVILCGFFTRADITVFSDFKNHRSKLSGVGGTLVTIGDPIDIELPMSKERELKLKNRYQYVLGSAFEPKLLSIHLIDASRLAPPGKSLAYLGNAIGIPKIELPAGYDKENMTCSPKIVRC